MILVHFVNGPAPKGNLANAVQAWQRQNALRMAAIANSLRKPKEKAADVPPTKENSDGHE